MQPAPSRQARHHHLSRRIGLTIAHNDEVLVSTESRLDARSLDHLSSAVSKTDAYSSLSWSQVNFDGV